MGTGMYDEGHRGSTRYRSVWGLGAALIAASPVAGNPQEYSVLDFGPIGGVTNMNSLGDVCGNGTGPTADEGFRWIDANRNGVVDSGELDYLDVRPEGYLRAAATSIADDGTVIGVNFQGLEHPCHPFLAAVTWAPGSTTPSFLHCANNIHGGNSAGDWVGDGTDHVGLLNGSSIGVPPGATVSTARGVSEENQFVCGSSNLPGSFLWQSGTWTIIESALTTPVNVNSSGVVVGKGADNLPYKYADGVTEQLTLPAGWSSGLAQDISDDGTIVGRGRAPDGVNYALIWIDDQVVELNTLIPPDSGLSVVSVNAINNAGQIAALAVRDDGTLVVVRLTLCGAGPGECNDTDTDGDGLLDSWETDGIDVDGDGTIDIDLPAMGADPLHKTLFVELDAMLGTTDMTDAIFEVQQAFFLRAPNDMVHNPDGKDGIDLFVLIDETELPQATWSTDPFASGEFDQFKALHFGTPAEQGNEKLLAFKRRIFRYCVLADDLTGDLQWLGLARSAHSNDFVLSDENLLLSCLDCLGERERDVFAATFMHELGHSLGLKHGGADDVNYKPNYISTMNYLEQFPFKANRGWRLDYSRGNMFPLLEYDLDERLGFNDTGGFELYQTTFWGNTECEADRFLCFTPPPDSVERESSLLVNGMWVDFNGDGVFSETPVCVDLNFMGEGFHDGDVASPCEFLQDSPDWLILKYALVEEGASPGGGTPPVELTVEQVLMMDALFQLPCAEDVDNDGVVGVPDLLAVLSHWSEVTGHPADVDRDGVVALGDLLALLAAWGDCT